MGSCASTNGGNTNSVYESDDIANPRNTNIDHDSNLKQASSTAPVLELLNGYYNLIFGPDPKSAVVKVDGDKLLKLGDWSGIEIGNFDNINESNPPNYGEVNYSKIFIFS